MEKRSVFRKDLQNLTLKSSCVFESSQLDSRNHKKKWPWILFRKSRKYVQNCLFLCFLFEKQRSIDGLRKLRPWWGFRPWWRRIRMGESSNYNEKKWKWNLHWRWSLTSQKNIKITFRIVKPANKAMDFKPYIISSSCCKELYQNQSHKLRPISKRDRFEKDY